MSRETDRVRMIGFKVFRTVETRCVKREMLLPPKSTGASKAVEGDRRRDVDMARGFGKAYHVPVERQEWSERAD